MSGPYTRQMTANNNQCQLYSLAQGMIVQDTKLPPSEADFQAWLDILFNKPSSRALTVWSARKLRRAVIMRRNGCQWAEVRDALGMKNASCVANFMRRLPEELRP